MYCTKCGTNNEDNNTFCKNCGAKLVKPANNSSVSSVPSSSGVAQAAKAVNVKLIAGIAAALVVVVMIAGVLMKNGASGGDSLFEQIKIGKTTAADVKKYLDKNNLDYEWGSEDTFIWNYLFIGTPNSNFFLDKAYFKGYFDGYGEGKQYAYGESTIHNTFSDTYGVQNVSILQR